MTKHNALYSSADRQGGAIDAYAGRGVWVPAGMTAKEIMVGAKILEEKYEVAPYESRSMIRDALGAIREAGGGNHQ